MQRRGAKGRQPAADSSLKSKIFNQQAGGRTCVVVSANIKVKCQRQKIRVMQFTTQIQSMNTSKQKQNKANKKDYQGIHRKTWRNGWKDLLQGQSGKAQRERGTHI